MTSLARTEARLGRAATSARESFGENFMVLLEKMKERKWNRERDEMTQRRRESRWDWLPRRRVNRINSLIFSHFMLRFQQ